MVRAVIARQTCASLALGLAVASSALLTGCALTSNRRVDRPERVANAPPTTPPQVPRREAPTSEAAVSQPPSVSLASTVSLYVQPEIVPAPPPSSIVPLAFADGTTLVELERLAEERH